LAEAAQARQVHLVDKTWQVKTQLRDGRSAWEGRRDLPSPL